MNALLEASGVSVRRGATQVLRDVDLHVNSGELVVLVGPNGAGKTTLLEVLAGVRPVDRGEICLLSRSLPRLTCAERARALALVGREERSDHCLSVETVALLGRLPHQRGWGPSPADRNLAREALRRFGCGHLLGRSLASLSDGERQRVHWARAEVQQPSVLLLDEATAHLDLHHREASFRRAQDFARRGGTILAVAHDLDLALRHADRICVLSRGTIVESGAPRAVLSSGMMAEVFGVDAEVIETERGITLATYGAKQ